MGSGPFFREHRSEMRTRGRKGRWIVVAEKHQLAGASRKDFLKRKKIAGESISEEKVEEDEDNAGEA
ncbi:hypothetical protein TWF173_004269 [Orbilia oligospora]|nr:hypothetical protein TWF173_004269 [Orbilia oligospora]